MNIYPAIDLLDGKCVRLKKGIYEDKTVFFENPEEALAFLEESGARYLHLVDLSGARSPKQRQIELIRKLVRNTKLEIQCGGGIRTKEDVKACLDLGIRRVVLGSLSVSNPTLTSFLLKEFGSDHLTLALDVRQTGENQPGAEDHADFQIATEGWTNTSSKTIDSWFSSYLDFGLTRVLCTDIGRDGMPVGPNLALYETLMNRYSSIEFQASGGMRDLSDLIQLKQLGLNSVIIGRAIYEGTISLREAIKTCSPNA